MVDIMVHVVRSRGVRVASGQQGERNALTNLPRRCFHHSPSAISCGAMRYGK